MEIYKRFFKVTEGPLVKEVEDNLVINKQAHEEYKKILAGIGASRTYYQTDNKLVGIVFDREPDRSIYKKVHSGWYPKKNNKTGKELHGRIAAIKTVPENSCLEVVGLSSHPSIFRGGKCYWPTLIVIPSAPPVCLVKVPWYDEDPEKVSQYRKDREKKTCMDRSLDSILWEAPVEMVEIKEWQFLKEIDDWNASLKPVQGD